MREQLTSRREARRKQLRFRRIPCLSRGFGGDPAQDKFAILEKITQDSGTIILIKGGELSLKKGVQRYVP